MSQLTQIAIEAVKGVGTKRGAVLKEAGIHSVRDLLYYIPRRYLDRSMVVPIGRLLVGQEVTLIGQVRQSRFIPGSRPRFVLVVEDESGDIACTWFQGGRYMQRNFREGDVLALSGKVDQFQGRLQMVHPEHEFVAPSGEQNLLHTGGIVPLYTASADMKDRGLRSRGFRKVVHAALAEYGDQIEEHLEAEVLQRLQLAGLADSLRTVHFPEDMAQVKRARRRLAFDELYALQLELARRRRDRLARQDGIRFSKSQKLVPELLDGLPFALTQAQRRVIGEIGADMELASIMSRLLQGDVGSGKTLVALCAMLTAVEAGWQAALMAPTEILAEQHFINIAALAEPLGLKTALLVGRLKAAQRRQVNEAIAAGQVQLVVGTHALIQEEVDYHRLGLAIVDEQHRFGVSQRAALYGKGRKPDLLVMTATPIPRTLALTMYGDLDVSVLDELPPGRKPVRTVLRGEDRRQRIFDFAGEQMRAGSQVYVVYPLIEESEKLELKSALEAFDELVQYMEGFTLGLLHGRMDPEEKSGVMERFKSGEIQMLVSTTVIEVGVDVPNATVMIIEHAERFGLAQLHQLRGRVGRGAEQAYCILVAYLEGEGGVALERLKALCQSQDGFFIAQRDLELRGQGELFGTRQAGLPAFSLADPVEDDDLLTMARSEALRSMGLEAGEEYPDP